MTKSAKEQLIDLNRLFSDLKARIVFTRTKATLSQTIQKAATDKSTHASYDLLDAIDTGVLSYVELLGKTISLADSGSVSDDYLFGIVNASLVGFNSFTILLNKFEGGLYE